MLIPKYSSPISNVPPATNVVATSVQFSSLQGLEKDTVSFGNNEFYRGVGLDDELNAILTGEKTGVNATNNKNGWQDNYHARYFISFKTDPETVKKFGDAGDGGKYRINGGHDLEDIAAICIGKKVGGDVVYSADWNQAKKNEFAQSFIRKNIQNIKDTNDVEKSLVSLSHYLKDYMPLLKGHYGEKPTIEQIKEHCTSPDGKFDITPIEEYLKNYSIPDKETIAKYNTPYEGINLRKATQMTSLFNDNERIRIEENLKTLRTQERLQLKQLQQKKRGGTITPSELGFFNTLKQLFQEEAKLLHR